MFQTNLTMSASVRMDSIARCCLVDEVSGAPLKLRVPRCNTRRSKTGDACHVRPTSLDHATVIASKIKSGAYLQAEPSLLVLDPSSTYTALDGQEYPASEITKEWVAKQQNPVAEMQELLKEGL